MEIGFPQEKMRRWPIKLARTGWLNRWKRARASCRTGGRSGQMVGMSGAGVIIPVQTHLPLAQKAAHPLSVLVGNPDSGSSPLPSWASVSMMAKILCLPCPLGNQALLQLEGLAACSLGDFHFSLILFRSYWCIFQDTVFGCCCCCVYVILQVLKEVCSSSRNEFFLYTQSGSVERLWTLGSRQPRLES